MTKSRGGLMKGKGLLLLGLLIVISVIGYLNLAQRKALIKNVNSSLSTPIKNPAEVPGAIKNQIEENLKQSQAEQNKNIQNE